MSKTIKLEDQVYDKLVDFLGKRETFSQAVARLLDVKDGMVTMSTLLEGSIEFGKFQREKRKAETAQRSAVGTGLNTGDDESP